ncbi:MAG: protein kinase, partial [Micrococcus sp.]|nr:protein kinase [Micrococcus sp.]
MDERQRDPLVGVIIDGRYLVRSRLARGGMSTVYLALDRRLEREVALKVMLPHLAEDPVLVERFEREAKTAARLAHPQVVQVLDQGHDEAGTDVLAYLVMEVVPGHTLRRVIREDAPLPPAAALRIIEAVLDGLSAAHEIGIMHRDVKPENVLVSPAGHIKVADFGLSRATTAHTSSGQSLVGTVAYLSPELVSGASADARSDVYAVGIVLYELLTGQQPYTAANPVQVATQHLHRRVPPPSRLVASVPEALDDLVLWCTEKDPALRPADATAVLREVQRLRAEPAVALETVPVPSTAPAARDHPDDDAAADAAEDAEVLIDADAESTHVRALDDAEAGRESAPTVAVRRADDETVALHRADEDAVALQRASDESLALNRPAAETEALPRRTPETEVDPAWEKRGEH